MSEPLPVTIASIRKNSREEVRIGLDRFRDHDLLNLRVWFEAEDGQHRPGKSGLAVKVGLLPELISALQQAEAEARRRGLLGGGS